MKRTTSDQLKHLIKTRKLRQIDILTMAEPYTKKFNIKLTKSDLSQFISGIHIPGSSKLGILALALDVSETWLMGYDVPMGRKHLDKTHNNLYDIPNIMPIPKMKKVPMLGNIACGEPIFAEEQYGEYIECINGINADFCLTCKGDSMINARIYDGDIVFIKKQPTVDNGQIGCVLIENDATLKRVYYKDDKVILRPANPLYDDMVFEDEELNKIKILGRAIIGSYNIK